MIDSGAPVLRRMVKSEQIRSRSAPQNPQDPLVSDNDHSKSKSLIVLR